MIFDMRDSVLVLSPDAAGRYALAPQRLLDIRKNTYKAYFSGKQALCAEQWIVGQTKRWSHPSNFGPLARG